jgi:hypothetical protein
MPPGNDPWFRTETTIQIQLKPPPLTNSNAAKWSAQALLHQDTNHASMSQRVVKKRCEGQKTLPGPLLLLCNLGHPWPWERCHDMTCRFPRPNLVRVRVEGSSNDSE